jgi:hypothetical protein
VIDEIIFEIQLWLGTSRHERWGNQSVIGRRSFVTVDIFGVILFLSSTSMYPQNILILYAQWTVLWRLSCIHGRFHTKYFIKLFWNNYIFPLLNSLQIFQESPCW